MFKIQNLPSICFLANMINWARLSMCCIYTTPTFRWSGRVSSNFIFWMACNLQCWNETHFVSVFPHHLTHGWADDARIDVPRKRYLLFLLLICYLLVLLLFFLHTVWRAVDLSHCISFQVSDYSSKQWPYFWKPKDVFVQIGNWTHWDSLPGMVTLSIRTMLQKLMYSEASFCLDSW